MSRPSKQRKIEATRRRFPALTLFVLFFHTLGFFSSVHAIMTNRTAQGCDRLGVSLNTFPYITVPMYWVFGRRRFEGYVEAWNDRQKDVEKLIAHMHDVLDPYEVEPVERLPDYEALEKISEITME